MATRYWIGASQNIKQTDLLTLSGTGDWVTGDTVTLTIASVGFVVTVGTLVTDAQVATTIKQAFNGETLTDTSASSSILVADGGASAVAQFAELTASVSSNVVTIRNNQAGALQGKPFTLTVTETVTGDEVATESTSVTATSQYHWNQADNWSANTVPVDGDTVIFDRGNVDVRYLMTGSIQVAQLTKYKSYTGNVGLAPINIDNNSKPYAEYRTPLYLTFDDDAGTAATVADLEVGDGQGSGRFMVDFGAGEATINVYGKGNRADTNIPCILLKGSAIAELNNLAGDVGVAFLATETSTLTTVRSGDGPASQAQTVLGSGCSLTTVVVNGGTMSTASAITTATQNGGAWQHLGGTVTAANILGGTYYPVGTYTITTLTIGSGGTVDTTKGTDTITVTNTIQMYKNSKLIDPAGRITNPVIKLNNCTLADVTIVLAANKTYTLS